MMKKNELLTGLFINTGFFIWLSVAFVSCTNKKTDEKLFNYQMIFNKDVSNEIFSDNNIWDNVKPNRIEQLYWGALPKDTLDLYPSFKLILDYNNIYFRVRVQDDIKYTHPIPKDSLERILWNYNGYDQVELAFFKNNIIFFEDPIEVINLKFNYGIDSFVEKSEVVKHIKFLQEEDSISYTVTIQIPWKIIGLEPAKYKKLKFDVRVYDNDRKFDIKGYDVFSKWETYLGWGGRF